MRVHTAAERPDLMDRGSAATADVWPEYNRHGAVLNRFWGQLDVVFPDAQFVLYDDEADEVLAKGHAIPCAWDGTVEGLPAGIDAVVEAGFALRERGGRPTALSALAAEIPPRFQGRNLSAAVLTAMRDIAAQAGLGDLIAPVRPNWKDRYPLTPIGRYATWTRPDGLPFDPWMRVHVRMRGEVLRPAPESLFITGTVADWERWTEMAFPESGPYVIPRGLAPVDIDCGADRGTYWEPNVWMRHRVAGGSEEGPWNSD